MMLDAVEIPSTTMEQRDKSHPGFVLICVTCGSVNVFALNDHHTVNDGDGRMDVWGSVHLVCADCKYNIDIMEHGVRA